MAAVSESTVRGSFVVSSQYRVCVRVSVSVQRAAGRLIVQQAEISLEARCHEGTAWSCLSGSKRLPDSSLQVVGSQKLDNLISFHPLSPDPLPSNPSSPSSTPTPHLSLIVPSSSPSSPLSPPSSSNRLPFLPLVPHSSPSLSSPHLTSPSSSTDPTPLFSSTDPTPPSTGTKSSPPTAVLMMNLVVGYSASHIPLDHIWQVCVRVCAFVLVCCVYIRVSVCVCVPISFFVRG